MSGLLLHDGGHLLLHEGDDALLLHDAVPDPPSNLVVPNWQHPHERFKFSDLTDDLEEIKASAGTLYSLTAINTGDDPAYIQIFDAPVEDSVTANDGTTVDAPVLGTTAPYLELLVPAHKQAQLVLPKDGKGFLAAITIAATSDEFGDVGAASGVRVFGSFA